MKGISVVFFLFLLISNGTSQAQVIFQCASPDAQIGLLLYENDGTPLWEATYKGQTLILPSGIGFILKDSINLTTGLEIINPVHTSFEETWQAVWGPNKFIRNHFNELRCHFVHNKTKITFVMVFRVFNDGIGFRYEFPEQNVLKDFIITDEKTQFHMAGDYTAWWIPADFDSYEKLYKNTLVTKAEHVNTPVTMRTENGIHLSIHEAALLDYSEMTLKKNSTSPLVWEAELVPWADGTKVIATTPFKTPWRTIQISPDAVGLVSSNLIINLNDPCLIEDVSWIRPLKYIGIWWGMHIGTHTWTEGERHGATTENAIRYIDFAADNNIQGVVIEGWNQGWDRWGSRGAFDHVTPASDYNLVKVADYARQLGVYLIMHHETGGDAEGYELLMDSAYILCRNLGIHALKTGYAGGIYPRGEHHHGQYMVRHYQKVVETAAKYQLMLNVHEPIKPTGLYRTWPNMMTREGVRGMEWNAWSDGNPPSHTVTLPFTRMLAGPLDYTPAIFDVLIENTTTERIPWNFNIDDISKTRIHTTLMHQVALFFILYSPMQMASDNIENYEEHPVFEAIRLAPADWDESVVLNGAIGEYITIARRSNNEWWISCATNEEARTLIIHTDFLKGTKAYKTRLYQDRSDAHYNTNPLVFEIKDTMVSGGDTLQIFLAPGGGAVIRVYE